MDFVDKLVTYFKRYNFSLLFITSLKYNSSEFIVIVVFNGPFLQFLMPNDFFFQMFFLKLFMNFVKDVDLRSVV